ncbi:MAG: beta-lactamase family protein [Niastella sp.]|nr:beta-lactamase family protein [Niastella sp.]
MIKYPLSIILIILTLSTTAQNGTSDKQKIQQLLNTFMQAITDKDSTAMYSLFADAPVTWAGIYQPLTQQMRDSKSPGVPDYKISDYKTWFRNLTKEGRFEERFANPVIVEDGSIASVTFDYSFWKNNQKGNWGKESWGLIKVNGTWKIASVLFSIELETTRQQPEENDVAPERKDPAVETYIRTLKDTIPFQGAVLIAKGDSVIHHAAYGMFDAENNIPNTTYTQFQIGSLTKSFTAFAVMQLAEAGKIDLQAPVSRYLPGLSPALSKGLTIHHLLKLQAGFPQNIERLAAIEIMDIQPNELLEIINTAKPEFKPGQQHKYTNLSYNLLAMVIEKVAQMTYEDYMKENVFNPLQMTHSGIERLIAIPSNRAVGYRKVNGKVRRVQNSVSYALGSGDIYSTVYDTYKWTRVLNRPGTLSEKSKTLLFDGGTEEWGYYGYGFRIQRYHRGNEHSTGILIRHGGTMNGFITNYHYYKEDDLTIIIFCNYRDIPIRNITYQLKELLLGHQPGKRANTFKE